MPFWSFLAALLLSCFAVAACSAEPAPGTETSLPPVPRPAGPALVLAEEAPLKLDPGSDPVVAASAAVRRKDWRLYRGPTMGALGVRCFTPDGAPPGLHTRPLSLLDVITAEISRKMIREAAFAARYNQVIVDSPDFPEADLCRPLLPGEQDGGDVLTPPNVAARSPARAPLSLHEAARRGTIADLRRFLGSTPRNQLDRSGMTPLAWAAVRGRGDIWTELVRNGEEPVSAAGSNRRDDFYWAIATGREEIVDAILRHTRGQLRSPVPGQWLDAAITAGNPRIIERLYALPHYPLWANSPEVAKWRAEAVEAALKHADAQTAQIVFKSAGMVSPPRRDLMQLAERYGARAAR